MRDIRQQGVYLTRKSYYPAIDGLRALAVLSVFMLHTSRFFPGGFIGVDLFFVISGFLITGLLIKETEEHGRPSVAAFYRRRALRILPALVVFVAVASFMPFSFFATAPSSRGLNAIAALGSFMNWLIAAGGSGGNVCHTWSLSIEEQFYALWAVCFVVASKFRRPRHMILGISVAGVLLVAAWRLWLWDQGSTPSRIYYGSDTRFDALLFGCAIACVGGSAWARTAARLWIVPSLIYVGAVLALSTKSDVMPVYGYTISTLASGWLVLVGANAEHLPKAFLGSPAAVWLGKRSYSFYLWHVPIIYSLTWVELPPGIPMALSLVFSLAVSDLSYRFVEKPFLRIKDASGPRARPPQSPAAPPRGYPSLP